MEKCPRCQTETRIKNQNYCAICGLQLKGDNKDGNK